MATRFEIGAERPPLVPSPCPARAGEAGWTRVTPSSSGP